jgi:hypothetical protein
MALEVLQSETVDSQVWSEAVKWLLLFGPPEIREMIEQASSQATSSFFPELTPVGYGEEGQPMYDIGELARSLGMDEEEALTRMRELEAESGVRSIYVASGAENIH